MELITYIQNNNITNFEILKTQLESSPFNLKIKEDNDYPDLFLICNQDSSDFSLKIVCECNGIILNKNTLAVQCYTFDKCSDGNIENTNLDFNELYLEYAIEGTLLRLFYYNDNWIMSTKKCIDAKKSRWVSTKNYYELVKDFIDLDNLYSTLNKNYCYSFILIHPDNKIVVNYTDKALYHISTRDLTTLNEIVVEITGMNNIKKKLIDKNELQSVMNNTLTDTTLYYEGYILVDKHFNRYKLKNSIYQDARNIWGNTNNRFYRFLELRKDYHLFQKYLMYFQYDTTKFIEYEKRLDELCRDILENYVERNIKRTIQKVPFYYTKLIYQLHGNFLRDRVKTDYNKVMILLSEQDPKKICYLYRMMNENKNNQNDLEINEMEIS
jgi:hypothetical protein